MGNVFISHVISDERHYLTGLRYVEDNAREAGIVARAEDWRWGSLWERVTGQRSLLAPSLVPLPADWVDLVNQGQAPADLSFFRSPTRARHVAVPESAVPPVLRSSMGG